MKETEIIASIKYTKKHGEYIITKRIAGTGKTIKIYANSLTANEIAFAESSRHRFETEDSVTWSN